MEFAHSLRHSKVNIKICQVLYWFLFTSLHQNTHIVKKINHCQSFYQYSYELLLQYLHKTQSTKMLGIINERINFQGKTIEVNVNYILNYGNIFCTSGWRLYPTCRQFLLDSPAQFLMMLKLLPLLEAIKMQPTR